MQQSPWLICIREKLVQISYSVYVLLGASVAWGEMMETLEDVAEVDLGTIVAALQRDYSKLSARLRELQHTVTCEYADVTLRLHFPAFRQGKATIYELVDVIALYMAAYALPRAEVDAIRSQYEKIPVDEFMERTTALNETARRLFKTASKVTGRNGECGELILYLLTEWVLEAPQLIAKMSLKTNSEMPVFGADGVHVKYCAKTSRLHLYWGESKLYADVSDAVANAIASITTALDPAKMQHELDLVKRNIDLSGFSAVGKAEVLKFLDPMEESYNSRFDVITSLIGFNFDAYAQINATDTDKAEEKFAALAIKQLTALAPMVATKLKAAGLDANALELFFLPIPSVQELRDRFQAKIGWQVN